MSAQRPARLQTMIAERRLREQAMNPQAVAALWRKAVESAGDAELPGMSVDGALRSAYDAGHLAALGLVGAYGLRTGTGQGHHEMAFAAAAATGHPGLDDLVPDSEQVRTLRRGSLYDPTIAGLAERDQALEWMRETLPALRAALVAADPALEGLLLHYPR